MGPDWVWDDDGREEYKVTPRSLTWKPQLREACETPWAYRKEMVRFHGCMKLAIYYNMILQDIYLLTKSAAQFSKKKKKSLN